MAKQNIKLQDYCKGKTYVFIDAANILYSQKTLGWRVDYKKIKQYIANNCQLKQLFFYTGKVGQDYKQQGFLSKLAELGYTVRAKEVKVIKVAPGVFERKGNLDIELAMDVMKHYKEIETCILLSGDSDFAPLIDELKREKNRVYKNSKPRREVGAGESERYTLGGLTIIMINDRQQFVKRTSWVCNPTSQLSHIMRTLLVNPLKLTRLDFGNENTVAFEIKNDPPFAHPESIDGYPVVPANEFGKCQWIRINEKKLEFFNNAPLSIEWQDAQLSIGYTSERVIHYILRRCSRAALATFPDRRDASIRRQKSAEAYSKSSSNSSIASRSRKRPYVIPRLSIMRTTPRSFSCAVAGSFLRRSSSSLRNKSVI